MLTRPRRLAALTSTTIAICSAVAASAGAATSTPFAGFTSAGNAAVAHLSADKRQIKVARTGLALVCADGVRQLVPDAWIKLEPAKSGKFSGSFADLAGTWFDGRATTSSGAIAGRLDRKRGRITGTWQLDTLVTQPDGTTVACSSGAVKFTLHARPQSSRVAGGYLGGLARDQQPIVFQLDKRGGLIKGAKALLYLTCGEQSVLYVNDGWTNVRISSKRKFKASVKDEHGTFADGVPFVANASVSGALDKAGRVARGTWRLRMDIAQPDGTTSTCDSGTIKFKLRR